MLKFKLCRLSFIICNLLFIILLSGCATVIEGAKGIAGISTKSLEQARKDAITRKFSYNYLVCFGKTQDILKQIDAYVYMQDIKKHMIALYVSSQDTTAVGIFFTEIDPSDTQIEVSSPSTFAKETIAKRLFAILEGLPDPVKKPAKEDKTEEKK